MSDFEKWLENKENLKDLADEINANWALVAHYLIPYLENKGFKVLSIREIEELRGGSKDEKH